NPSGSSPGSFAGAMGTTRLSGSTTGWWPRSSSNAAVRLAPGSGRVTRRRIASVPVAEEIRSRPLPHGFAGAAADCGGGRHVAAVADSVLVAAVRRQDAAGKLQGVPIHPSQGTGRRTARPVERGQKGAFAGKRDPRFAMVDRFQHCRDAAIPGTLFNADR